MKFTANSCYSSFIKAIAAWTLTVRSWS